MVEVGLIDKDVDVDLDPDVGASTGCVGTSVEDVAIARSVGADVNVGDWAYNSVHLRAVQSCCTQFLMYSVAIEGTGCANSNEN